LGKKSGFNKEIISHIKGIGLIALGILCIVGLQFPEQAGTIGIFAHNLMRVIAGDLAILISLAIITIALRFVIKNEKFMLKTRLLGILSFMLLLIMTYHFNFMLEHIAPEESFFSESFNMGYQHEGGGLLGAAFSIILYYLFGEIASYVIIITLAIVSILLILNISLTEIWEFIKSLGKSLFKAVSSLVQNIENRRQKDNINGDKEDKNQVPSASKLDNKNIKASDYASNKKTQEANDEEKDFSQATSDNANTTVSINQLNKMSPKLNEDYNWPPLSLLNPANNSHEANTKQNIKERALFLEKTLQSFGVQAKVVNYVSGPTVTRFEVQPDAGVKVSKILNLADDIALNLAASGVRIEAPIPGKAALGIEVPNEVTVPVHFREMLESHAFQNSNSPLTIALGKDITGVPVVASLEDMPHLLIAGATGSGKSVCVKSIICSMLFNARPDQVKCLLIDPKMVELNVFKSIPHLLAPVLTNPQKASSALKNMIKEMIKRYDIFAEAGVRDIAAYNEKLSSNKWEGEFLPYIVVVIDELADLMLVSPAEVEDSISRLAQMSRAAGIHLVIATQRPSVDVLTGIIKANITSRIAFTTSSQVDSRTILDMAGAEKLLGKGDMLYYPLGMAKPVRVQNAFISTEEIKALTDFLKQQNQNNGKNDVEAEGNVLNYTSEETEENIDPLFADALKLVTKSGHASISLLQRRFRIGYTRAARLIDELETKGVVGEHEGSKPRQIIMSEDELINLIDKFNQNPS